MGKKGFVIIGLFVCFLGSVLGKEIIKLPKPSYKGNATLEEVIFKRKSTRSFKESPVTLHELSQLVWACAGKNVDGLTGPTRVYPSAGGIYSVELYLVIGSVKGIEEGFYRYEFHDHSLSLIKAGDFRSNLSSACLNQSMVKHASVNFIFAADASKVSSRYPERGKKLYLPMDVGASCENLHLSAESLGLGTVMIGAFNDQAVKNMLGFKKEDVYCIMPVGRR